MLRRAIPNLALIMESRLDVRAFVIALHESFRVVAIQVKHLLPQHGASWRASGYLMERMIQEGEARVGDLRRSIKAFKELRDSGELFPGTSHESLHADLDRYPTSA